MLLDLELFILDLRWSHQHELSRNRDRFVLIFIVVSLVDMGKKSTDLLLRNQTFVAEIEPKTRFS